MLDVPDPPFASGHWVPELVRRAGGWELLGRELDDRRADVLGAPPRGRSRGHPAGARRAAADTAASFAQAASAGGIPDWFDDLAAVRDGELFAVSAALVLAPGPRLVEGIAMLAELFDPEGFAGAGPEGAWIPLSPVGIGPNAT